MGQISRVTTFVNGNPPFADDLNAEMNQIISTGNNLDNNNFLSDGGTPIDASKFDEDLTGTGFNRDEDTGALSMNVDDVTLDINGSNQVEVKNLGVSAAKILDNSVSTIKIQDGAVTKDKIATSYQLSTLASDAVVTSFNVLLSPSVTITSTGRPIMLCVYGANLEMAMPYSSTSSGSMAITAFCRIFRGVTGLNTFGEGWSTSTSTVSGDRNLAIERTTPCTILYVDNPGAGTYTYTLRATTTGIGGGTPSATFKAGLKFFAMEL